VLSLRRSFVLISIALVYVISGKLGLKLAFVHQSATAVWPPTGIALAAMLIFGRWIWPSVLLGAFVVNLETAGTVWTSLGIGIGNTLEAVTGSLLVNRFACGRYAFLDWRNVFRFAVLAGVCSTAVAATIGVLVLCLSGLAPWATAGPIWFTWWIGDGVGAVLFAPALVLWAQSRPIARQKFAESLLLAGILVSVSMVVFGGWLTEQQGHYPLEFTLTPILLWSAFRLEPCATATMIVLLAGIALWGTLHGYGPFITPSPNESLLLLQAYLGVSALMVLAIAAIVWESKLARHQIELQSRELARSNAELEQFAYAASHDLKEPLRTTNTFTQLLAKKYRGQLDEQADEYIHFITSSVARMSALIEGILQYSRLSITSNSNRNADANYALETAMRNLAILVNESGATVMRDALPVACIDESELALVFQNLISNAIKYHGDKPPQIHVSAARESGTWLFSVADNGVGIEPQYREQAFGLFKRLHGPDTPGAGIGLAVCKKIVERHGGNIWIDSPSLGGTRVCFRLNQVPEHCLLAGISLRRVSYIALVVNAA
jgi:signal transduction histidine kinase